VIMGRSNVTFTNSTGTKIYVAYMRVDYDCETECGSPWDVLGWIGLNPGETETRANPTKNRWFYYYAEDANGATWSGPYLAEVIGGRFRKCKCLGIITQPGGNPYHEVGFRELDTNSYSGVNFIT
jgi:uncharacterized membrane protein